MSYVETWLNGMIGGVTYCLAILILNILRKRLDSVLAYKIESWYFMMSVLLGLIIAVVDIVNWGTSNGIMVVSNMYGMAYYNQIFSHISICLFTILLTCIAVGFVFFMNKIYIEQQQKQQYNAQIEYYKMLNEQYMQKERLRHDMKNHILALHGLWGKQEFDKVGNYLEKMMKNGNIGSSEETTGNHAIDALLYQVANATAIPNI